MDNLNFWKTLRVLTTNICNYRCVFCHNEGQEMNANKLMLSFENLKLVIDALKKTSLKEIQFSGGEPFLNPDTLHMIQYVDNNTNYEIGCATNTIFLDENLMMQLSKTRIKLNIQFPATTQGDFHKITKTKNFEILLKKIDLLQRYNVKFGLNHCITNFNSDSVFSTIEFAKEKDLPLKLLPDLNSQISILQKEKIFSQLDEIMDSKEDTQMGAVKWKSKSNFQVKYIDSPCFYKNFETCKKYAEIRLLPDFKLQTCIMKQYQLDLKNSDRDLIKLKFQQVRNDFISC